MSHFIAMRGWAAWHATEPRRRPARRTANTGSSSSRRRRVLSSRGAVEQVLDGLAERGGVDGCRVEADLDRWLRPQSDAPGWIELDRDAIRTDPNVCHGAVGGAFLAVDLSVDLSEALRDLSRAQVLGSLKENVAPAAAALVREGHRYDLVV